MRVIIAEKPSMAREIAKYLPGSEEKANGYIQRGGHLCNVVFRTPVRAGSTRCLFTFPDAGHVGQKWQAAMESKRVAHHSKAMEVADQYARRWR